MTVYIIHNVKLAIEIIYRYTEISLVCFVFQLLIICGSREITTNIPAVYPRISINNIILPYLYLLKPFRHYHYCRARHQPGQHILFVGNIC